MQHLRLMVIVVLVAYVMLAIAKPPNKTSKVEKKAEKLARKFKKHPFTLTSEDYRTVRKMTKEQIKANGDPRPNLAAMRGGLGDVVHVNRNGSEKTPKDKTKNRTRRNAQNYHRWPTNVANIAEIPYYFHTSTTEIKNGVALASKSFDTNTCIRIKEVTSSTDIDMKVKVVNGNGCNTEGLGKFSFYSNGEIKMSLQSGSCTGVATVLHEFMHIMGFDHEQNRADRDNHITIITENIDPAYADQFDKGNDAQFESESLGPYDFDSVMHYDAYGASKGGWYSQEYPCMERKVHDGTNQYVFGNEIGLTELDIQKLNAFFNCSLTVTETDELGIVKMSECVGYITKAPGTSGYNVNCEWYLNKPECVGWILEAVIASGTCAWYDDWSECVGYVSGTSEHNNVCEWYTTNMDCVGFVSGDHGFTENDCLGPPSVEKLIAGSGTFGQHSTVGSYPPSYHTIWEITTTVGGRIELTFDAFDTEPNYDWVRVYDGPSITSTGPPAISGNTLPASFTSSGPALTIQFVTNAESGDYAGFTASYAKLINNYAECVEYMSGSGVYNANCEWYVNRADCVGWVSASALEDGDCAWYAQNSQCVGYIGGISPYDVVCDEYWMNKDCIGYVNCDQSQVSLVATPSTQQLTSHANMAEQYPVGSTKYWTITAEAGVIQLEFLDFFGIVFIYDGPADMSNFMSVFSPQTPPSGIIESTGTVLTISFSRYDDDSTLSGFHAEYVNLNNNCANYVSGTSPFEWECEWYSKNPECLRYDSANSVFRPSCNWYVVNSEKSENCKVSYNGAQCSFWREFCVVPGAACEDILHACAQQFPFCDWFAQNPSCKGYVSGVSDYQEICESDNNPAKWGANGCIAYRDAMTTYTENCHWYDNKPECVGWISEAVIASGTCAWYDDWSACVGYVSGTSEHNGVCEWYTMNMDCVGLVSQDNGFTENDCLAPPSVVSLSSSTIESYTLDSHTGYDYADYADPYPSNYHYIWEISAESGIIELTFLTFDTEAEYDWVRIYDGPSVTATLLLVIPATFTSTGPAVTIQFATNADIQNYGFSLSYINLVSNKPECIGYVSGSTNYNADCEWYLNKPECLGYVSSVITASGACDWYNEHAQCVGYIGGTSVYDAVCDEYWMNRNCIGQPVQCDSVRAVSLVATASTQTVTYAMFGQESYPDDLDTTWVITAEAGVIELSFLQLDAGLATIFDGPLELTNYLSFVSGGTTVLPVSFTSTGNLITIKLVNSAGFQAEYVNLNGCSDYVSGTSPFQWQCEWYSNNPECLRYDTANSVYRPSCNWYVANSELSESCTSYDNMAMLCLPLAQGTMCSEEYNDYEEDGGVQYVDANCELSIATCDAYATTFPFCHWFASNPSCKGYVSGVSEYQEICESDDNPAN